MDVGSNTEIQSGATVSQSTMNEQTSSTNNTGEHSELRTGTSNNDPLTDFERLYGEWLIWTPGGATNLYYKDTGNYATHEYTPGAEQGTITIYANGTYVMDYNIWGEAEGEWRLSYPAEINGERIQAIVLLNGSSGYDWAVAPSESGKIRLLYHWGTWADGSSSWFFDSELVRK